jgi:uncharacterized SAM-binding protein YcdF (DUF218 family)
MWLLTNALAAFLLPPLNLLLLGLIGLLLWRKRPRVAYWLTATSLLLLWLCSTPYVAETLLQQLERTPPLSAPSAQQADAIVVLGGGQYFHAPEYGGNTVHEQTLVRLRYAARLQRETGLPILVTSGHPEGSDASEASHMQRVLEQEFKAPVRWLEEDSDNTFENARLSHNLLAPLGINRIYLVTHAWHMPRAQHAFQAAGFNVIPAPTGYTTRYQINLLAFLPDTEALRYSRIFMHEVIGMVWYWVRGA